MHVWWRDGSRGQELDYTLAARRIFPNEDLLDRNTDLSPEKDLERWFLTPILIEIPNRCHELEEERYFIGDAERRDRRDEQLCETKYVNSSWSN